MPSTAPKMTAAAYAQLRRDNENEAREALRPLVPEEYFTEDTVSGGELNNTTKVLIATTKYIQDIQSNDHDSDHNSDQPEDRKLDMEDDIEKKTPFSIPYRKAEDLNAHEEIRQLRQVATRLVQKIEGKLQSQDGISEELKKTIDAASDTMIDLIETIEKAP